MDSGEGGRFRLRAELRNGRKVALIKSFQHPDPDIAKFLERVIEDQLMIRNRPVTGETA